MIALCVCYVYLDCSRRRFIEVDWPPTDRTPLVDRNHRVSKYVKIESVCGAIFISILSRHSSFTREMKCFAFTWGQVG